VYPDSTTYNEWYRAVSRTEVLAHHRLGQHWFTHLSEARPDIAAQVRSVNDLDPFYNSNNLESFHEYVSSVWNS
jgi:hypothetical protein